MGHLDWKRERRLKLHRGGFIWIEEIEGENDFSYDRVKSGSPEPDELEVVLAACQDWCWCWVGHVCDGIGVGADAEGCRSEVRVREIEMLRLCWHQSETTERDDRERWRRGFRVGRKGLEIKYCTKNYGRLNFLQFIFSEKDLRWPVTALVTDTVIPQFSVV